MRSYESTTGTYARSEDAAYTRPEESELKIFIGSFTEAVQNVKCIGDRIEATAIRLVGSVPEPGGSAANNKLSSVPTNIMDELVSILARLNEKIEYCNSNLNRIDKVI